MTTVTPCYSDSFLQEFIRKPVVREMLKFMSVGVVSLGISMFIFHFAKDWLRTVILDVNYRLLAANGIAFAVSLSNAFLLNSRITFRHKKADASAYWRYGMVNLVGLTINSTLLLLFTRLLASLCHQTPAQFVDSSSLGELLAYLAAVGCSFFWNFFMSRLWVFRSAAHGS